MLGHRRRRHPRAGQPPGRGLVGQLVHQIGRDAPGRHTVSRVAQRHRHRPGPPVQRQSGQEPGHRAGVPGRHARPAPVKDQTQPPSACPAVAVDHYVQRVHRLHHGGRYDFRGTPARASPHTSRSSTRWTRTVRRHRPRPGPCPAPDGRRRRRGRRGIPPPHLPAGSTRSRPSPTVARGATRSARCTRHPRPPATTCPRTA